MTLHVTNVGLGDHVDVSMQSHDTTFATPPAGCVRNDGRDVTCFPGGTGGGGAAAPATGDYTVTLPLQFPDSMVDDDLTVTVKVNGDRAAPDQSTTFRPTRTPIFDFAMPQLTESSHSVSNQVDNYDFSGTVQLPSRVQGLRFTLTGNARFRSGGGCTVGDADPKTLTCPDAADGDQLTLPVAADSLTDAAGVSFAVSPVITFDDPDSTNNTVDATLRPGADLLLSGLSVLSANPDRDGRVVLQGDLAGVRPGMGAITYDLQGAATFPVAANPGCSRAGDGKSLVCDNPSDGAFKLVVAPDDRHVRTDVTVGVSPNAPFVSVGSNDRTPVTLPGRPTQDTSFTGLHIVDNGHNLSGNTDVYRLSGTVGGLPAGVDTLDFAVDGATVDTGQADPSCARVDDATVECTNLDTDPNPVITATSTQTSTHTVTVTAQLPDPFDDPDTSNNSSAVSVSPGVDLTLASAGGALHQGAGGDYHATVTLGGVRTGLPSVFLDLGGDATYAQNPPACTRLSDTRLECDNPSDGTIDLAIVARHPAHATDLSVTATPGGDFEQLSADNVADLSLSAFYDFSIGALSNTDQSVSGDTDHYTLHTTIGAYPDNVGPLTYAIDGANFAANQTDCKVVDATHVTCGDGPVNLAVDSTSTSSHDVTVTLQTPDGYDDPDATNNGSTITVRPGVDLKLAGLDPDNESPANDDRLHKVATTLSGTRKGLGAVTYTLTGNATFVGADVAGCTADGKTLTCTNPSDGPVTFTVRADDVHVATPIDIAVSPADPFLELDAADNSDGVTLLPRPTYDFSMGALSTDAHTVTGGTDHYTLSSHVAAVPSGVPGLTFTVDGGTFAATQDTGCSRGDDTHVTCTGLGSDRTIGFRVDSTDDTAHAVGIALTVPSGYDDTDSSNDSRSTTVSPGIDLAMGALTPSNPKQASDGTFTVSSTLTGVRSGPVHFDVAGATVTGSSCTVTSGSLVTCGSPTEGQNVSFTLRPSAGTDPSTATITARPADRFTELNPADNDASVTLTPTSDMALNRVSVLSDLVPPIATVRAQISGVPRGASTIRVQVSGATTGTGNGQVHLTGGADGATGLGDIDCYTSDGTGKAQQNGLFATCTNVQSDTDGSFWVDMSLSHPHGRDSDITVTAVPVGFTDSDMSNNSLGLTLH